MAGQIGTQILLGIEERVIGASQAISQINQTASAVRNVNTQLRNQGSAGVSAGRGMQQAGVLGSAATQKMAQSTFRFTFYALMAIRVGQTLMSKVFIEGSMQAANSFQHSFTLIDAVLQTTTANIEKLKALSIDVAMKTPFDPSEVAEGIRVFAKAGWSASETASAIFSSTELASIGEMKLADAVGFTATALKAYGHEASWAANATNLIAFFSNKSIFSMEDLMTVMGKVGATAHAYGQNMAQTLQLATAFAQVGTSSSETGTMMRQLYTRASRKTVAPLLEGSLRAQGLEPLYSGDTGKMTNVGQAYVALAKTIQQYEDTLEGADLAEFGLMRDQELYTMFGIRSVRSFLSLSSLSMEKFQEIMPDALAKTLEKAAEYEEKYMTKLRSDWAWAKAQAGTTMRTLQATMGNATLSMTRPFIQGGTEIMAMTNSLITMNDTTQRMIPMLFTLGGVLVAVSGMTAIAAGTFMLVKTRLADMGSALVADTLAMARMEKIYGTMRVAQWHDRGATATIGMRNLTSYAASPMRMLGALTSVGAIIYYAWSKNLGGLKDMTTKFFGSWNSQLNNTGTLGERIADKFKNIFQPYTKTAGGHTGTYFGSMMGGISGGIGQGGVLDGLIKSLVWGFKAFGTVLKWFWGIFKVAMFPTMMKKIAGWLGGGDIGKGFERIGQALGALLSVAIFEKLVFGIGALGKSLMWLAGQVLAHTAFKTIERGAGIGVMGSALLGAVPFARTGRAVQGIRNKLLMSSDVAAAYAQNEAIDALAPIAIRHREFTALQASAISQTLSKKGVSEAAIAAQIAAGTGAANVTQTAAQATIAAQTASAMSGRIQVESLRSLSQTRMALVASGATRQAVERGVATQAVLLSRPGILGALSIRGESMLSRTTVGSHALNIARQPYGKDMFGKMIPYSAARGGAGLMGGMASFLTPVVVGVIAVAVIALLGIGIYAMISRINANKAHTVNDNALGGSTSMAPSSITVNVSSAHDNPTSIGETAAAAVQKILNHNQEIGEEEMARTNLAKAIPER